MPTFPPQRLDALLQGIYRAVGVPDDAAATVARHQIRANLVGHDSHGVIRTAGYVTLIEKGDIVPDAAIEIVQESPSSAVVDAHWGLGFVATERAVDLACDKAEAQGVGAVTVRRQGHIGRLGAYTARAAERGMIALITADSGRGPKAVAPFGGREARLGTNPLSIAIPSAEQGPVVLDMATSTVAGGKVKLAASRGQQLPAGWIVDKHGAPSTDPAAYADGGALLPLGADQGHKGYGLSFVIEVLSGLLTGIGFGVYPDGIHNDGVFLSVFSVERFRPLDAFQAEVSEFIAYLKDTPTATGFDEIYYPGEIEARNATAREQDGIAIEDRTWQELTRLADRLGVDHPEDTP